AFGLPQAVGRGGPHQRRRRGADRRRGGVAGDARSFNASLGTIPDYAGPPGGAPGVLLAGVRGGAPAEKGGLRRGDILTKLGTHSIGGVEDLMYALNASKPGETVTAVVKRDGKELKLQVTFEEGRRGK
ncbi:MAG TPA: PDZ domain-containing protein, partial [Polyangia bacterium]